MTTEFDFKGQHNTDLVNKTEVKVTIKTSSSLVKGTIHIMPDSRIKDFLNNPDEDLFIAVTKAIVFDNLGVKMHSVDFLALNRKKIEWLTEDGLEE